MTVKKVEHKLPDRDALGRFRAKIAEKAKAKVEKALAPKTFKITALAKRADGEGYLSAYIQLPSTSIPACKDRWGYKYPEVKLKSDKILVTSVYDYDDGRCYIAFTYLEGGGSSGYCSSGLMVSDVADEKGLKAYEKWKIDNLHLQLYHRWKIGSDPEIFVENKKKEMIPAFLFLGSKEKPNHTPKGGAFQTYGGCPMYWDGFQAEFTTKANTCLGWHMDSIAAGMHGVYAAAKKKFPDAKLSLRSVFDIPDEVLKSADEEHVAFGCMPSINAYGLKANMPPARQVPFRSAGGHIHFGIGKISEKKAVPIVKALDAILAVSCVSMFAKFDDPKRRVMYGLPGEFRLPKHGMEYRPLSNAWLCHPMITNLVIDFARKVVVFAQKGYFPSLWDATEEETLNTVIKCDVKNARKIMERNKSVMIKLIKASYHWATEKQLEFMYSIFLNGAESFIKDPSDFEKNWNLKGVWIAHSGNVNMNVADAVRRASNNGYKTRI